MEWLVPNTQSNRCHPMSRRKQTDDLTQMINWANCLTIVWLFGSTWWIQTCLLGVQFDRCFFRLRWSSSTTFRILMSSLDANICTEPIYIFIYTFKIYLPETLTAYRLTRKELFFTAHRYQQWDNKSSKVEKSAKQRPLAKSCQTQVTTVLLYSFVVHMQMKNDKWREVGIKVKAHEKRKKLYVMGRLFLFWHPFAVWIHGFYYSSF